MVREGGPLIRDVEFHTVIGSHVDDAKMNLIREQNLAETAQATAQALRRRRNRIMTADAGRIVPP